jgi:hypothetical protein
MTDDKSPAAVTQADDARPDTTGVDCETAAWAWLERKFGTENEDPCDRAYAADEMVDAFHAGAAHTPPSRDQGEGERIAEYLVEQRDEPYFGDTSASGLSNRLHYWRDKSIMAARRLLALTAPQDAGEITLPRSGGCAAQGSVQSYGAAPTPGKEG